MKYSNLIRILIGIGPISGRPSPEESLRFHSTARSFLRRVVERLELPGYEIGAQHLTDGGVPEAVLSTQSFRLSVLMASTAKGQIEVIRRDNYRDIPAAPSEWFSLQDFRNEDVLVKMLRLLSAGSDAVHQMDAV